MANMMPNVTEEQGARLNELLTKHESAYNNIARFAHQHEDLINQALELAGTEGIRNKRGDEIYMSDQYSEFDEDEDGNPTSLAQEFKEVLNAFVIANQRFIVFSSTGKDDTLFADKP